MGSRGRDPGHGGSGELATENRYSPPAYGGVTDQVTSNTYDWQVHGDSVQLWPHCPVGVDCFGFVGTLDGAVLFLGPDFSPPGPAPMEFRRIFPR